MNTITNIHKPSPYAIATDLIPFIPVANHWYVPHGDKFYPLNEHSLTDLLNNRIAAIKVPHFLSEDECAACIKTIDRQRQFDIVTESVKEGESCIFETVSFSEDHGLVKRVGISQSEYTWEQRESYFDQVHENAKFVHTLECDPLTRTTKALQASWPYGQVSIACENGIPGSPKYFAGLLRQVNHGTFAHFDFSPFHAGNKWTIGQIDAQLSWNIFLTQPDHDGSTIVYDVNGNQNSNMREIIMLIHMIRN